MKTLIVTGGIATGKSTAIRLLMEEGGPRLRLFDCDAEAGRLLDGGSEQALELPTLIGLTQHSFEM